MVQVPLAGAGYIPDLPDPAEQIEIIIEFFDLAVAGETLVSAGPKKALDQFRGSLVGVQDSINAEDWEAACKDLYGLYVKSDGIPRPPDPIEGSAIPVLSGMIETLLTTMNCTQLD